MNKLISIALLSVLGAGAKAPTARVTISGGTLRTTIEVTDPRVLDLSEAWGTAFLDKLQARIRCATARPQVLRDIDLLAH